MTYRELFTQFQLKLDLYANGIKTETFDELLNDYTNLIVSLPPSFLDTEITYDPWS